MIFEYPFGPVEDPRLRLTNQWERSTPVQDPVVSKVCRQLRSESLPIFYARQIFFLNMTGFKEVPKLGCWSQRNNRRWGLDKFRLLRWATFCEQLSK